MSAEALLLLTSGSSWMLRALLTSASCSSLLKSAPSSVAWLLFMEVDQCSRKA